MNRSGYARTRMILLLDLALFALGCASNTTQSSDGGGGGSSASGSGSSNLTTRSGSSGGQSATGGKPGGTSTVTANRGGNDGRNTASAMGGSGGETPGTTALGGTLSTHQGGNLGSTLATWGGSEQGGSTSSGGTSAGDTTRSGGSGGAQTGGTTSATGGTQIGGTTSTTGAPGTGGIGTGGTGTGGNATNPSVGDGFRVGGIHGFVYLAADPSMDEGALAGAAFYDAPMRVDAFAAFPPELHEVKLQQGACVLTKAATRACNPPCGSDQYCGVGNSCKATPVIVSAGVVSIAGPVSTTTLNPSGSQYTSVGMALQNIASGATVAASSTGGAIPAFSVSTLGVDTTGFGVDGAPNFELKDGEDKLLSWTSGATGTVQLLLNAGWHGAPPTATVVCEAAASGGHLVVPRALIEAFPPQGGMGLIQHTSAVRLFQRKYVTAGSSTIELLVVGARVVISPIH